MKITFLQLATLLEMYSRPIERTWITQTETGPDPLCHAHGVVCKFANNTMIVCSDDDTMEMAKNLRTVVNMLGIEISFIPKVEILTRVEPPIRSDMDVHTEHCCVKHGCKYGSYDCTVTTGLKKPSFSECETCAYEKDGF